MSVTSITRKRVRAKPRKGSAYQRLAGIEYAGLPGVSASCKEAVLQLLQCGTTISRARLLSCKGEHSLVLTSDIGNLVAVKSGFSSGYIGEGPAALSSVLAVLYAFRTQIDEVEVSKQLLERLDASALTVADLAKVRRLRPRRSSRWADYVFKEDFFRQQKGTLWGEFAPVVPFAIIDTRLADLALEFRERPDYCLLIGYRRLEDGIRERIGIDEHGVKLFGTAFQDQPYKLTWEDIDKGEHDGRALLFIATFKAYRNPRAHREPHSYGEHLTEFLALNNLFLLEAEAIDQSGNRRPEPDPIDEIVKESLSRRWKKPKVFKKLK